jgi:hypothetical protein
MIAARVAAQQSIMVLVIDATANKTYIKNELMEGFQKARFQLNYYIIYIN